jgi:hypothetical protein
MLETFETTTAGRNRRRGGAFEPGTAHVSNHRSLGTSFKFRVRPGRSGSGRALFVKDVSNLAHARTDHAPPLALLAGLRLRAGLAKGFA